MSSSICLRFSSSSASISDSESLDSSLAGEGSDDLATLICAECRYMLSVKTVRPRIHLIENACGWFAASCTSSHASQSTDRVLEPPLCRLLPQITAQRLLGKLTSDRGKRLATGHRVLQELVAGSCKCKEQFVVADDVVYKTSDTWRA